MLDAAARCIVVPEDALPLLLEEDPGVLQALSLILPVCLAGAVSPVLLTEQTVLLAGPGGRTAGRGFAIGAIGTLTAIALVLVFFGHVIDLPSRPKLSASLDVGFGAGLLAAAALVHAAGRRKARLPQPAAKPERDRSGTAVPFGAISMATNFTTLALVVIAAKEISAADVGTAGHLALVAVLVAICSLPAWAPLALTKLAPRSGDAALRALGDFIDRHGRTAIVALLAFGGAYLLVRGIVDL